MRQRTLLAVILAASWLSGYHTISDSRSSARHDMVYSTGGRFHEAELSRMKQVVRQPSGVRGYTHNKTGPLDLFRWHAM